MTKEVILTPLAVINYENIIDYLFVNWGARVTENFIKRFEKVCDILVETPGIYPYVSKVKKVQKCVLTKHNIIYFKDTKSAIRILTIFDTRQTPEKLSLII